VAKVPQKLQKYYWATIYQWYSEPGISNCGWRHANPMRILAASPRAAKLVVASQLHWVVVDPEADGGAYLIRAKGKTHLCFAKNPGLAKERVAEVAGVNKTAWSTARVVTKEDPDQSRPSPSPVLRLSARPYYDGYTIKGGDSEAEAVGECPHCGFQDHHRRNSHAPCINCGRRPPTDEQVLETAYRQQHCADLAS